MKKILVIEDEQALREDILEILGYENFEAFGAENGVIGMELARHHLPDLVLCDIMMPEMDGYAVLMELRSYPPTAHIPLIFLTAKTGRADMRRGMELGADDYLTKPFTQPELIAAIQSRLTKQASFVQEYEHRLDALRSNVIRAMPHELRTSLTGIIGYARMMIEDVETLNSLQIIQMAEGIDKAAKRLHRLIENYLLYAQIELLLTDLPRLEALREQTATDVELVIHDIALQKAQEFNRANDLQYTEDEEIMVKIPLENMEKIVTELLDNAFKFSPTGTPVTVSVTRGASELVIIIKNAGRGMTAEQVAQIGAYMQFERRFYEQSGLGLGLVIAKRLTELHLGQFQVESTQNVGTTIQIQLPLVL